MNDRIKKTDALTFETSRGATKWTAINGLDKLIDIKKLQEQEKELRELQNKTMSKFLIN